AVALLDVADEPGHEPVAAVAHAELPLRVELLGGGGGAGTERGAQAGLEELASRRVRLGQALVRQPEQELLAARELREVHVDAAVGEDPAADGERQGRVERAGE